MKSIQCLFSWDLFYASSGDNDFCKQWAVDGYPLEFKSEHGSVLKMNFYIEPDPASDFCGPAEPDRGENCLQIVQVNIKKMEFCNQQPSVLK